MREFNSNVNFLIQSEAEEGLWIQVRANFMVTIIDQIKTKVQVEFQLQDKQIKVEISSRTIKKVILMMTIMTRPVIDSND